MLCDVPARVRDLRSDVPRELDGLVQRCLDKDRDGRFADVTELAQALTPFASPAGRSIVSRVQGIAIGGRPRVGPPVVFGRFERLGCSRPNRAVRDSRLTRIPGERLSLTPMLVAIGLVAMAILGAAGSLGYDIVHPLDIALGRGALLRADPVEVPPLAHELELRFAPQLGPARAHMEHEAGMLRPASIPAYPSELPSSSPLPPEAIPISAVVPADPAAIPPEP